MRLDSWPRATAASMGGVPHAVATARKAVYMAPMWAAPAGEGRACSGGQGQGMHMGAGSGWDMNAEQGWGGKGQGSGYVMWGGGGGSGVRTCLT